MPAQTLAASPSWDLLPEKDEQDLHKHRLLNIEEKPFKRIIKRLASVSSLGLGAATTTPYPQLQEELALDFAAFNSSISRLQFLLDANARERTRYTADQQRILGECESVRARNAALRTHLDTARGTLAQRKAFDELAERITANRMLRPRADQAAALAKLDDECAELERESALYRETWRERRLQFARIMDEGMQLRRLIRDEKEEVERREGMHADDAPDDGDTPRVALARPPSGNATPHTDSGAAPEYGLKPRPDRFRSVSRSVSRADSREPSPRPAAAELEEGEDTDMDEVAAAARRGADTPQITVEAAGDKMEVDST